MLHYALEADASGSPDQQVMYNMLEDGLCPSSKPQKVTEAHAWKSAHGFTGIAAMSGAANAEHLIKEWLIKVGSLEEGRP